MQQVFQRNIGQFGQEVGIAQRQIQHAEGIADSAFVLDVTVGDDMRHIVAAVFIHGILNDFVTAHIVEVHVDIGHGASLRIEETFEKQVVFNRVHIGNAQGIGHGRPGGRTPSGAHHNTHFAGLVDHIPNDEEISRKTHILDNAQFVFQPLARAFVQLIAPTAPCAFPNQMTQIFFLGFVASVVAFHGKFPGHFEHGHNNGVGQGVGFHLVQNFPYVVDGVGKIIPEKFVHLRGRFQVKLLVGQGIAMIAAPSYGLVQFFAVADTKKHFLNRCIFGFYIINFVAGHQFDLMLAGQKPQTFVQGFLGIQTVPQDFQVKIIAENIQPFLQFFFGLCLTHVQDKMGYFAVQAARNGDKPFAVLPEQILVYPGVVVITVGVGYGHQFDQIMVSGFVFGQQYYRISFIVGVTFAVIVAHQEFHADDGFDFFVAIFDRTVIFVHGFPKLKCAHHIALVGQGYGGHTGTGYRFDQLVEFNRGFQYAKLAVKVQVGKIIPMSAGCFFLRGGFGFFVFQLLRSMFQTAMRESEGRKHTGIAFDESFQEFIVAPKSFRFDNSLADKLKENPCRGFHVGGGVVGFGKILAEKELIQFTQFGQFETAFAPDAHQFGRAFGHGIQNGKRIQSMICLLVTGPLHFGAQHAQIEAKVMPHKIRRLFQGFFKPYQSLFQWNTFGPGQFRTDAVHLLGIERNIESVGTDNQIASLDDLAPFVVQLPGQLYHPRPMPGMGFGQIFAGKSGGLGVENKKHKQVI